MPRNHVTLRLDRDSVAMGDDMQAHAVEREAPAGLGISAAIAQYSITVGGPDWAWVVLIDNQVTAVWSSAGGVRMLVPDRQLTAGTTSVYYRYFMQVDAQWLHEQLASGVAANRDHLTALYAPIAAARFRQSLRDRERDNPERLLSADCVAALKHYGADITLHCDTQCEFTVLGADWCAQRADTMFVVFTGSGTRVDFRPHAFGEAWLVARVGAAVREHRGLAPLIDFVPRPGLDLAWDGRQYKSRGDAIARPKTELEAQTALFANGRTIAEVRAELGV